MLLRGLGLNTMKTIGILCADSSDIYLAKAVYFIEQNLRKEDIIWYFPVQDMILKIKETLDMLLSQHVDSVVMIGSNFVEAKCR